MKFQNLSVKRLFGRVAIGLALSMSGITIALFFVTKQTAVLLTGGVLLLCALVGIFVLTQAFGTRLSQFTADLCQTLDHMIAGNEAPQRPEDSETQLARIGHRLARLYQIMQENRRRVAIGLALSMSGITIALFLVTKQTAVLLTGGALLLCALVGIFVLTQAFGKRLSQFTADLCQTLDHMIAGNEAPQRPEDSETQLARIGHRLARLYQIMQENRRRVDEERQELQTLVSDISHQVKTPVSNLKMATDTLLEKPMTEAERIDFIRGIRSQTDKLDFLFQALVKTSRLETGVIQLDKKLGRLFDTVAQAMSGIVYAAEKKGIAVSVDCPEDLTVFHDSKWTSEALFNLLDNAVKYTPAGGKIAVSVVLWEMYVEIKVTDTGKGISESNQAAIFRRFYREEEVHEQQGVGIGLYLAREIVTRQGGYIKVVSEPGKGSEFSIMLPTK